jgi:outer membrane protein assembly factor BamB
MKTLFAPGEKGFSGKIIGLAVNATTGKTLWSVALEGVEKSPMMYAYSDSTSRTPATDGKHVWFFNATGEMGCWAGRAGKSGAGNSRPGETVPLQQAV